MNRGTPKNLREVVDHIMMEPGGLERVRQQGVAIVEDYLNQRFGTAILEHSDEPKVLEALEKLLARIKQPPEVPNGKT